MRNIVKKIIILGIVGLVSVVYAQIGRDVKVISSNSISYENGYEENLTIVANKICIINQEKFAKDLVERCIDNNFCEIMFSYDIQGYPNGIHLIVYTNDIMYKNGIVAFEAEYKQKEGESVEYSIKDNADKFSLFFYGNGN